MKRVLSFLLPVVLFSVLAVAWSGCKKSTEGETFPVTCTPGTRSTCPCAKTPEEVAEKKQAKKGQHLCNPDGHAFGRCEISDGVACPAGEGPPKAVEGQCSSEELNIIAGKDTVIEGPLGGDKKYVGSGGCAGAGGNETVYGLDMTASGTVSVTVEATGFNPIVYVKSESCESGAQVACSESKGTPAKTSFQATAGTSYSLFVDSDGAAGTFKLTIHLEGPKITAGTALLWVDGVSVTPTSVTASTTEPTPRDQRWTISVRFPDDDGSESTLEVKASSEGVGCLDNAGVALVESGAGVLPYTTTEDDDECGLNLTTLDDVHVAGSFRGVVRRQASVRDIDFAFDWPVTKAP